MKKEDVFFKIVIHRFNDSDPNFHAVIMEGDKVIEHIKKAPKENALQGLADCLEAISHYTAKMAVDYRKCDMIGRG